MWNKQVVVLIVFCTLFSKSVFAGYFTAVGPRTVQYGSNYKLTLVASDGGNLTDVHVMLKVLNGKTLFEKDVTLIDDQNQEIAIMLKNQTKVQDYNLIVTSESFSQSVIIKTISKKCSVLIQTDKAIYKPGDTVQYRIIVLDSATKPYYYAKRLIKIADADGKVLFNNETVKNDNDLVVEKSFQLSSSSSIGEWTISVDIGENPESSQKVFEVRKYVQPHLQVFADTKSFLPISQRDVVVKVYAKYNSGEFAKGKAKVSVKSYDPKTFEVLKQKEYKFENTFEKQILVLDMTNDLNVYMITLRDIKVNISVEFEEDLTKENFFVEKTVTIHQEARFDIEFFRQQPKLKPGFPYEFTAIVRQPDGSLEDYAGTVKVKAEYYYGEKCKDNLNEESIGRFDLFTSKTLENGKAKFVIDVPQNTTDIELTISYHHNEKTLLIEGSPSKTNVYLGAKLKNSSKLEAGETVSIEVKSFWKLSTVYYAVIGRTGDLISGTMKTESNQFEILFKAETWMIPEVQVMVYYIHPTGEVIYDVLTLSSEKSLPNRLTITPSSNSSQPNDSIDFMLHSKESSIVYLLAVDRSAKLLRTGNDIDEPTILSDLKAYDVHRNDKFRLFGSFYKDNRYVEVGSSNTFIITNAYNGKLQNCRSKRSSNFDYVETSNSLMSRTREDFHETWFFEKVEVDSSGNYRLSKTVPAAITTWDITGFAISLEFGLAIAKPQTLGVSQDFFLKVHLPYSAKVGEVTKVEVSVFNYIEESPLMTDVDVTLFSDGKFNFFSSAKSSQLRLESDKKLKTHRITIKKGTGASTSFFIKASKAGNIQVKVQAELMKDQKASDEVHRVLKVQA